MTTPTEITRAQAVALYGGSQAELARALGVARQQINRVPAEKPLPLWMAYRIRYELRPDAFIAPDATTDAAA